MYILWSSAVHQKRVKMAGNWAKMVRLDIMSKLEREYSEKTLFLLLDLSPTDTVFVLHF